MADLKLQNYDMMIENGDVTIVTGIEAVAQDVTMQLRTFLGESRYDKTKGVPFREIIFRRGQDVATIEQVLRQIILSVTGVETVNTLTINQLDTQNRVLNLEGKATGRDGEFDFSGVYPYQPI